ncbi:BON domain-containing protein [Phenylobacterium sp.]|jgi:osmotically-inducible protein OsmY|uniref:BON domain-containing protein n=1 Tax=Phenylobacterium sp. TaxID=1871053 RepID=UPI003784645C
MSEWNRNDRGQTGGGRDRDSDDWRRREREQRDWGRGGGSASSGEDRSFGGGQQYGQDAGYGYGGRSQGYGAQRDLTGGYDEHRYGTGSRFSNQGQEGNYSLEGSGDMGRRSDPYGGYGGGYGGYGYGGGGGSQSQGRQQSTGGGQSRQGGQGGQMFGDPNEGVRAVTDGEYERGFMGFGRGHGEHRGKGPKNYTRSDDRIREDVHDRLADDSHIDASEIEVQVKDGEVTLSGTVNSRDEKRHAEDIIERVSGVKHVQNNLRIQQSGGMSGSTEASRSFGGAGSTTGSTPGSTTGASSGGMTGNSVSGSSSTTSGAKNS